LFCRNIERVPPSPLACRRALASALVLACGHARGARAATPLSAEIEVERGPGADGCPERDALVREIAAIIGPEARLGTNGGDVRASISFARSTAGFQSTLRLSGARAGERTLTDTGPTCTALGRAVGITIALLLDPGLDPEPARPAALPPPPPPTRLTARTSDTSDATSAFVGVTFGPAIGLVGAPTVDGGIGLDLGVGRHFFFQLDGHAAASRATAFDMGTVEVGLVTGRLRACASPTGDAALRLGLCAAVAAGQLRGEGRGYATDDRAAAMAWMGAGGGVQVAAMLGRRWRVGLGADVLVPVRKSTFSIGNRGVAFQSSALAAVLGASVGVKLW
jgi:hypothetical protein